jgi:hypothetical protein
LRTKKTKVIRIDDVSTEKSSYTVDLEYREKMIELKERELLVEKKEIDVLKKELELQKLELDLRNRT